MVAMPAGPAMVTTALAALAALTAPVVGRVARTGLLDGFGNTKSRGHVRASNENTRFRRNPCKIRPFMGAYHLKDLPEGFTLQRVVAFWTTFLAWGYQIRKPHVSDLN